MKHILLVDDDPDIRELVVDYFGSYFMITLAQDGADGLKIFKQHSDSHPFHLILTDVMMPNLDGISLAKQIKEITNIPIIAISGAPNLDPEAIKIFDVLYTKPFQFNEVYAKISSYLGE